MKYAPPREDGLYAYVVSNGSAWPGSNWKQIRWAANLADAKLHYGHTRELHNYRSVRRATPADMEALGSEKVYGR